MPAATGSDVVREHDGVSVALELAALSAFVVLLRYAAVLYANHLLATLSAAGSAERRRRLIRPRRRRHRAAALLRRREPRGGAATATECAVCLGSVEDGETARALPCCAHAFHARCVDAWLRLRPTWPVCRATCR